MARLPPGVLVYSIEGPFFFGAAEAVEQALIGTHSIPKILIIRLLRVPFMDLTGLQRLEEVTQVLKKRGVRVIRFVTQMLVCMEKSPRPDCWSNWVPEGYFSRLPEALAACQD